MSSMTPLVEVHYQRVVAHWSPISRLTRRQMITDNNLDIPGHLDGTTSETIDLMVEFFHAGGGGGEKFPSPPTTKDRS